MNIGDSVTTMSTRVSHEITEAPSPSREDAREAGEAVDARRFHRGKAAFRSRDFRSAADLFLALAGTRSPYRRPAGRYLARMYAVGLGLPRDEHAARYWCGVGGVGAVRAAVANLLDGLFVKREARAERVRRAAGV